MITNISRQLTTGALAIAGSVAAFGFAGAAPAQAQRVCGPEFLPSFIAGPCQLGDKLFTYIGASGFNVSANNFITITQTLVPEIHTVTFTPVTPVISTSPVHVLEYSVELVNDPATPEDELLTKAFDEISGGYTTTGMTDYGVSLEKTVWSGSLGGTLIGTSTAKSTDIGGTGSPGNILAVPPNIKKIYIRDTFSVSVAGGQLNSITNDFTQKSIDIPEPSAILGILAVAGAGAFARRKS